MKAGEQSTMRSVIFSVLCIVFLFFLSILFSFATYGFMYPFWLEMSHYETQFVSYYNLISYNDIFYRFILFSNIVPTGLTGREIAHLYDIGGMLHALSIMFVILLFIVIIFVRKRQYKDIFLSSRFRKILLSAAVLMVGAIGLGAYINFLKMFEAFHHFIFTNDWWLLRREDILINVYPPVFFEFMASVLLTIFFVSVILTIVVSKYKASS